MKIKHFLGWLFGYCPYGGTCPPMFPFKRLPREENAEWERNHPGMGTLGGGGGC